MVRTNLFLLAVPFAVACVDADTRTVGVASDEVQKGALSVTLDYSGETTMEIELLPSNDSTETCPMLGADARWTLIVDDQSSELEVTSFGGGFVSVDCALKCHDLVALENVCAPAKAQLRGPVVDQLLSAGEASTVQLLLEDEAASVIQPLSLSSLERRSVAFDGGTTITTSADRAARVAFTWSHPGDRSLWAKEASEDDELGRFRALEQDEGSVLSIGARNTFGPHAVYMGSTAGDAAACAVGECRVQHVLLETLTLETE